MWGTAGVLEVALGTHMEALVPKLDVSAVVAAPPPIRKKAKVVSEDEQWAPDGGWGWMVVAAYGICLMTGTGPLPSFALLFADIFGEGSEGADIASVMGIYTACCNIAGLTCALLYRRLSFRQTALMGGVLFIGGATTSAFAASLLQLTIAYGVLQGVGFGLMMHANVSSMNTYFRRRRTAAMAVAQAASGLGALLFPLALHAISAAAGRVWAQLAVAGAGVVAAAAQTALRPVGPPPGGNPAPGDEEEEPADGGGADTDAEKTDEPVKQPLLSEEDTKDAADFADEIPSKEKEIEAQGLETTDSTASQKDAPEPQVSWWRFLVLPMRDPIVWIISISASMVHTTDITFFSLEPFYLVESGFTEAKAASMIAAANGGDLAGRILLTFVGGYLGRHNRLLFVAGTTVSVILIAAFPAARSLEAILGVTIVLGAARSAIYVAIFLVLAEYVPVLQYPASVSFFNLTCSVVSLSVSPIIGAVRDRGNFALCFWVTAALMAICPVSWAVETAVLRFLRRRRRHSAGPDSRAC